MSPRAGTNNRKLYQLLQLLGRTLRVDHVNDYKPPKDNDKLDDETRQLHLEGCAPKLQIPTDAIKRESLQAVPKVELDAEFRLPERLPIRSTIKEEDRFKRKIKKEKKSKKSKKNKKSRRRSSSSSSESD